MTIRLSVVGYQLPVNQFIRYQLSVSQFTDQLKPEN